MTLNATRPPAQYPNYPASSWEYVVDKTGTIWQTVNGRLVANGPWGVYVFRCPPKEKPQQVYFLQDGHGDLYVDEMNKRLVLLTTDKQWQTWIVPMEGYIYPSDCPDTTVVNIDESQLSSLRQQVATAQMQAAQATAQANAAINRCNDMAVQLANLNKTVAALQNQVNALLTPSQVSDLVWQKLKDMNYLYRLGFNLWPTPSPDPDIRAYVDDLVSLIKRVPK